MTSTPKSDRSQTRFSTPVSDLDDHRNQPASLPRVDTNLSNHPGSRRGTLVSAAGSERLDMQTMNEALQRHGTIARDFEDCAVAEDNESVKELGFARAGSSTASPIVRRNTFRRPLDPQIEKSCKSRSSSTSSSSESPPNSVDAFADHRRRDRAATVNSRNGSDFNLTLNRTVSGGTHRKRPIVKDDRAASDFDSMSRRSSVEGDVCFPVSEEPGKTTKIDFEDLEEFVAECVLKAQNAAQEKEKPAPPKVFNDLRPKQSTGLSKYDTEKKDDDKAESELKDKDIDTLSAKSITGRESIVAEPPPVNRWTFFSSELDDTIHAAELGDLLMPGETFRDLFEQPPDEGVWWLDMINPTEDEIFVICKAFGVHPLTREDITTQETREKVELFNNYYFVCFRSFYQVEKTSEDYLDPVNVYAVVFREGLLTFTFCQNPHASNVRKRISRLRDYVSLSSDWICYALIDDIVDSFGPVIRDLEHETDAIEDQVFTARAEDSRTILRAIGECRKRVILLLRLLGGKADVVKGFAKRCNENYNVTPRGDVGMYLSDIQDHVVTMMSNLSHFEKMLSRSHSNYLAQISVDNLQQGNAVNETLGKVTVIATILVPLNLICGLFGMNVPVPGRESGGLAWFFGILGFIFLVVFTCLTVAKRLRYI